MNRTRALAIGAALAALVAVAAVYMLVGGDGASRRAPAAPTPTPLPTLLPSADAEREGRAALAAILAAGSSNDFAALRALMGAEAAPAVEALKARFEPYTQGRVDWIAAASRTPSLVGPPARDSRQRMIVPMAVPQVVTPQVDLTADLFFAYEGGQWRFADFALSTRGNPENKPAIPSAEEAKSLIRATLGLFADGCAAQDFKPLFDAMAEPGKRGMTPEKLAELFEGWPERKPDAERLRRAELALSEQPGLDANNLLALDGRVEGEATPKGGLRFSLRYCKEGENWKAIGIQLFPETP